MKKVTKLIRSDNLCEWYAIWIVLQSYINYIHAKYCDLILPWKEKRLEGTWSDLRSFRFLNILFHFIFVLLCFFLFKYAYLKEKEKRKKRGSRLLLIFSSNLNTMLLMLFATATATDDEDEYGGGNSNGKDFNDFNAEPFLKMFNGIRFFFLFSYLLSPPFDQNSTKKKMPRNLILWNVMISFCGKNLSKLAGIIARKKLFSLV